ncbi:MAG: porin family protein [Paludibacteraceae bacterium]
MKTVKFFFIVVLITTVSAINAQITLGVRGGLNLSNISSSETEENDLLKSKLGFHAGLAAEYNLAPSMAVQSGLFLTTKGATMNETNTAEIGEDATLTMTAKATMNAMYLQIPVHFAYKADINSSMRFVVSAGPYVAYGVGGNSSAKLSYKTTGTIDSEIKEYIDNIVKEMQDELDDQKTKTFDKEDGLKPFDFGVGISGGFEFGKIVTKIGWDMGLINIARDSETTAKNMNAYLTVGYNF